MHGNFLTLLCALFPKEMELLARFSLVLVQHYMQSALGKAPFFVLYAHEPMHWGIEASTARSVSDLNVWLSERKECQR